MVAENCRSGKTLCRLFERRDACKARNPEPSSTPVLYLLRFCLVRTIRYLAVPVSLVKLLKVLNREEV